MVRGYDPYIQHVSKLLGPITNFGKSLHPWHPRLKGWGGLSSCMFLLNVIYFIWNALPCLNDLIWMTLKKPSTMNFCHSQNHSPVKVKETWVIEAFGLSISCCVVGLWRANGHSGIVRTAVPRHIFQGKYSLGIELEGLLGWQIHTGMPWSCCLYSIVRYSLSYGPYTLRAGHRVSSKVG